MSELKAYAALIAELNPTPVQVVYLKSEADKVINELKAQKAQVEDDCAYWKMNEINAANAMHETEEACMYLTKSERHNKYKRCKAMAIFCDYSWNDAEIRINAVKDMFNGTPSDELLFHHKFFRKWRNRWLELAEKFKVNV